MNDDSIDEEIEDFYLECCDNLNKNDMQKNAKRTKRQND